MALPTPPQLQRRSAWGESTLLQATRVIQLFQKVKKKKERKKQERVKERVEERVEMKG